MTQLNLLIKFQQILNDKNFSGITLQMIDKVGNKNQNNIPPR